MVLNVIWVSFFIIAFVVGLWKLIVLGDTEVFPSMVAATFSNSKTGFEISLALTAAVSLWLGLMKIGEKGGLVPILAKLFGPFFSRLFPEIPRDHPVMGPIMLNFSANMLGLDNAATPLGLKAMEGMQELNPNKDTASNAQIMFLVLNTSGLTIIPINVMVYRAEQGALDPSDIFLPILLATFFSTMVGLVTVAIYQRINLFDKVILAYLGGFTAFVGGLIYYFTLIPQTEIATISSVASNVILFSFIIIFIVLGISKKINIYETFIEGAKEGFQIAIRIIPFLIAILVAVGVFRACGAMDLFVDFLTSGIRFLGINTDFTPALPTAIMKPLSGSGARGMMVDTFKNHGGVDSFPSKIASTIQGSTDTTFYVLAVYFGSVSIKKTRYAMTCGLIADFAGIVAAIMLGYLFFH